MKTLALNTYEINLSNLTVNKMVVNGMRLTESGYQVQVVGGADGRSGRCQLNTIEISADDWDTILRIVTDADLISDFWAAPGIREVTLDNDAVMAWLAGQVELVTYFEEASLTAEDVSTEVTI